MKRLTALIIFLISSLGFSQQIHLKGQVSIHNSKYNTGTIEYVKDAFISAPFTKPANTDVEGKYQLEFVGIEPGTSIQIAAEKAGLEVVNSTDLQQVSIGRKFPLRIFLTSKGKLAEAQTEFYNVSKKALFKRKDALIARLRKNDEDSEMAIAELEAYFGHPISNRFEAQTELITRMKALEKKLPEFARSLAQQNLDFASDLYITAFEYFKKGEIEKAIQALNDTSLEDSYKEGKKNIAEGKKLETIGLDLQEKGSLQILEVIKSYELKTESFLLLFQYAPATVAYEKVIEIYEDNVNEFEKKDLASRYNFAAMVYSKDGKYSKALYFNKKSLVVGEEIFDPKDLDLAASYNNMAITLRDLAEFQKALYYQKKSLAIYKEVLMPNNPDLASSYSNIAVDYVNLREYTKALEYQMKSLAIRKVVLDSKHPDLAFSYHNIAVTYKFLADYQKALDYQKKSLAIREEILDPKHPDLAGSYNSIAVTYVYLKDFYKALDYQKKSLTIRKEILNPKHPDLANSYSNIAVTYNLLKDYQKALDYQKKALNIRNEVLKPNHPDLAISYISISYIHYFLKDLSNAKTYRDKARQVINIISPESRSVFEKRLKLLNNKLTEKK